MKLAFLAARHSIHTVRWLNALAARGHEVQLITVHKGGEELDEKTSVYTLPFPAPVGYFLNIIQVKALLRQFRPDLLHAHYASGYGTLGRLSGFHPYVLSVWGPDVYTFPYRSSINLWIAGNNLRAADWVCSTSYVMAEQTRKLCPEVENLSITPFGVDTYMFRPRPSPLESKSIIVGTVKTLSPLYGIDIFIRAFAEARQRLINAASGLAAHLRLLLVGDGPDRGMLEALTRELGVDKVTEFTGHVPHVQVPDYLNRMDVYIAASRSESFGVAVIEASACGLPVVVSNVGGLPEVVVDGVTGFVVERENVRMTARALLRLIEEPVLRRDMGKAGRQRVLDHYGWTESVTLMEEVYAQMLDRNFRNQFH